MNWCDNCKESVDIYCVDNGTTDIDWTYQETHCKKCDGIIMIDEKANIKDFEEIK